MLTCGLKLTHDGAIALLDDNRLVFSIEMEKIANRTRYQGIEDLSVISSLLRDFGYRHEQVDHFVIDGFEGLDRCTVRSRHGVQDVELEIAPYRERTLTENVLRQWQGTGLVIDDRSYSYVSYTHAAGHIVGTWCASPFGQRGQSAFVLVWDGGMAPRLYHVNAPARSIQSLGPIALLIGHFYAIFAQHFGPFRREGEPVRDSLSVPGKVMAYIALGEVREEILKELRRVYTERVEASMEFALRFSEEFYRLAAGRFDDADVLASFHVFLERILVENLQKRLERWTGPRPFFLCLAGGCALNIKWNSAIRSSGYFEEVWVPPFPNDSGSALGTACAMRFGDPTFTLEWDVFRGPALGKPEVLDGWRQRPCSVVALAEHIQVTGEPVVFLNGRAELGPRALGNRSILAAASSSGMKDLLNKVKERESYRPVSPICLEEPAARLFDPGCPDPYMLFDHRVRDGWRESVPAVVHLDGTARLQTVSERENPTVAALLREYERISGIPLLCNTSANWKGCGFFPDVQSAMEWGRLNYVWSDGILYERTQKLPLL